MSLSFSLRNASRIEYRLREAFVQRKESVLQRGALERSLCARSLRPMKKTRVLMELNLKA